ncbi:insulinase family protein [Bacteroidales bacterium OttesenSCG-928-L19]|nr:insulinase family protein [Bacteroidales bacterium OttesenSCG-928-L19]
MSSLNRAIPPEIQEMSSFSLTKPVHITTKNSIPVWFFENSDLKLIHFALRIRAGSLFEPRKMVAHCTWHLLQESARKFSSEEVEDFLDYYGSSFSTSVNLEYVTINIIAPERNCDKILPFIFDFILQPKFAKSNLNRFKQKKIKDLEYEQLKIGYRSGQLMSHALFNQDIPAGKILQREDIESITTQQLADYHANSFCAENVSFFVAGTLSDDNHTLLKRLLESIPKKELLSLPILFSSDNPAGKIVFEKQEGSVQSSIRLCRKSFGYTHPDRRDFSILSTLLGGYFGSRLMQNLREIKGYTYGIYSMASYFGDASIFYMDTDVNVQKTEDAIVQCKIEMNRLMNESVDEEELQLVKNYMMGSLLRKLDGTVDYMRSFIAWQAAELDEREADKMASAITKITPSRLMELARKYLMPEDYTSVVVGEMAI